MFLNLLGLFLMVEMLILISSFALDILKNISFVDAFVYMGLSTCCNIIFCFGYFMLVTPVN